MAHGCLVFGVGSILVNTQRLINLLPPPIVNFLQRSTKLLCSQACRQLAISTFNGGQLFAGFGVIEDVQ